MHGTEVATPEERKASSHFLTAWVLWPLGFLVIYFLSIGPAILINKAYPSTTPALEVIYQPITSLMKLSSPVETAVWWYAGLWTGR